MRLGVLISHGTSKPWLDPMFYPIACPLAGVMLLGMLILVSINAGKTTSNVPDILYGWVVPRIPAGQALTVVGSVGGVLTPSALFLGSSMVLTRTVNRGCKRDVRRCMWYSTIELCLGMLIAFFIFLVIVVTFANGFYRSDCAAQVWPRPHTPARIRTWLSTAALGTQARSVLKLLLELLFLFLLSTCSFQ